MLAIWTQYWDEVSSEPTDLREVGAWAIKKRLWAPRPVDVEASFARDMGDALRDLTGIDKDGREYRAFIPAQTKGKMGFPFSNGPTLTLHHAVTFKKASKGRRVRSLMTASHSQ